MARQDNQTEPAVQEAIKEYELAVAFAKELMEELGKEKALQIIAKAFEKLQVRRAKELAEELGDNSLETLARYYQKRAAENENLHVLEVTDSRMATKISRCRALEAFTQLGAPEICRAYCGSDYAYVKAFNPRMKLIRTKTLADGDDCCNHIWALEPGDDAQADRS